MKTRKQQAREYANPTSYGSPLTKREYELVYNAFIAGYEQGHHDLTFTIACKSLHTYNKEYNRRYDLQDRGKK